MKRILQLSTLVIVMAMALAGVATATGPQLPDVQPESFGAVGDGSTNDRAAVQAAFDFVTSAGGGRITFTGGKRYHLGSLPTAMAAAIQVEEMANVVVEGNGAELIVNTTAAFTTEVINLINPVSVRFRNLRMLDTGADIGVNWQGAVGFRMVAEPWDHDGQPGDVIIEGCFGENLLTFSQCAGDSPFRLSGVTIRDCRASRCYYGINCQNNGDGLRVTGFRTDNVRRPYFVYGVEDHDVELSIHHSGGSALGSSAACIVGNIQQRDTRGVRLQARFFGDTSKYLSGLDLEHQRSGSTGGLIKNVDATINVLAPSAMVPVRFRSYLVTESGSLVEQSATANRWDEITLNGNLATTGPESIAFGALVSQGQEGRLVLSPGVAAPQGKHPHYPGFAVSTGHGRELRTLKGQLSTQSITIPLARLDSLPVELVVTTWAQDDTGTVALAKRTYCRDLLWCQNAGGAGPVSVSSQTNLENHNRNGAATVSYAGVGENLVVTLGGYTGPNGLAGCTVEYISRGP